MGWEMAAHQITGNVGLYFACYKLSKHGWNVMPTSRNAKGIDIVAYDVESSRYLGIQVKALSKRSPVPLGTSLTSIRGDFWLIVTQVSQDPITYVMLPEEVSQLAHRGEKDGRVSYWLQQKAYDTEAFRERWERIR